MNGPKFGLQVRSIRAVYRRLLQQVERPPALDFQAVFDGPTLLQLATPAAGKAGGPTAGFLISLLGCLLRSGTGSPHCGGWCFVLAGSLRDGWKAGCA